MKKIVTVLSATRHVKGSSTLIGVVSLFILILAYVVITYAPSPEHTYHPNEPERSYHPDEGGWVAAGKHYFQKFFLERDWSYETWSDRSFGGFGIPNPVGGKYLIGLSLFLNGVVDKESDIPGYSLEGPYDWSKIKDKKPPLEILEAARIPMKWMGVLATVLLFLLVRELTKSWVLGLIASIFFVFQPQVIVHSQQVLMDIPALFYSIAALLVSLLLLKGIFQKPIPRFLLGVVIIGLFYALALQTKLNSLLALFTIIGWAFLEIAWSKKISIQPLGSFITKLYSTLVKDRFILKRILYGAVTLGLTLTLCFIIPNPVLYKNTLSNTKRILLLGRNVARHNVPKSEVNDTFEKKWSSLVSIGLDRSGVFRYWLNLPSAVDKTLVFLGLIFWGLILFKGAQEPDIKQGFACFGLWAFLITIGLLAWVPFSWPRWYVPMTPIWAILEAFGVMMLIQIFKLFRSRLIQASLIITKGKYKI